MENNATIRLDIFVFCKPINKPTKTYILSSAGAENNLIEIYLLIKRYVSSDTAKCALIVSKIG